MTHALYDAAFMRNLINSIDRPATKPLLENAELLEDQLLLETEQQVHEILIPALNLVFESYRGNVFEADSNGYTDEEILALSKKFPNIKDLIAFHKSIDPSKVSSNVQDSAMATAKQAVNNVMKKTRSRKPIVKDPTTWVQNKEDRLLQALDKADPKGKYSKLGNIIRDLPAVVKKYPKTANTIVGLMGVAIPILSSGYWWAAPATAILTKTVMDVLNGSSLKSAIGKNFAYGALGAAMGFAGKNFDSLANTVDSWLNGQSTPTLSGDVDPGSEMPRNPDLSMRMDPELGGDVEAGSEMPRNPDLSMRMDPELGGDVEAGSEMPRNPDLSNADSDAGSGTGRRSFPGEVGYDEPDRTGTGIPSGEAGDYAADRTGTGIPSGEAGDYAADRTGTGIPSGEAGDYAQTAALQPREYTVKPGDTLSTLAQKKDISVRELMAANPQITNPDQLRAGETINIPSETGSKTYDQGVGTASDTAKKMASGQYRNR